MIQNSDFNEINSLIAYLRQVPYDITQKELYTASTLYKGYNPQEPDSLSTCYDTVVYQHFLSTGKT